MTFKFKIINHKKLRGVKIIKNSYLKDKRGFLYTIYNKSIEKKIIKKEFDNIDDKIAVKKKNFRSEMALELSVPHGTDSSNCSNCSCHVAVILLDFNRSRGRDPI